MQAFSTLYPVWLNLKMEKATFYYPGPYMWRISSSWNTCLTPFPTDILNVQPKVDRSPFQGLLMRGKGATGGVWGLCTPWQNHYMLQLSKTCEKNSTVDYSCLCLGSFLCVSLSPAAKKTEGTKDKELRSICIGWQPIILLSSQPKMDKIKACFGGPIRKRNKWNVTVII